MGHRTGSGDLAPSSATAFARQEAGRRCRLGGMKPVLRPANCQFVREALKAGDHTNVLGVGIAHKIVGGRLIGELPGCRRLRRVAPELGARFGTASRCPNVWASRVSAEPLDNRWGDIIGGLHSSDDVAHAPPATFGDSDS